MAGRSIKDAYDRLYRWAEAIVGARGMEKILYLVFGGLTTVINFSIFKVIEALFYSEYSYIFSVGIAWIAAVAFAFVTNKFFVFRSVSGDRAVVMRELRAFVAARLASLLFEYLWMLYTVEVLSLDRTVAKILAAVIVVVMNYFFSKLLIFKKKASVDDDGGNDGNDGRMTTEDGGVNDEHDADIAFVDDIRDDFQNINFEANRAGRGAGKGFLEKYGYAALSFFMPILLLLIAYAVIEVYPFGKNSILIIDNHHQYTPFLIEFGEILRGGKSLLYSWTAGLGSNYLSRLAYYLSSPLNLFAVFISDESATEFVLALVLVRAGAAGLAFFHYLKAKFHTMDLHPAKFHISDLRPAKFHTQSYIIVAFAVMYSLCGYFLAYYWNIMWFDCIAAFPLVVLGIERLADRGTGLLYCLSLAYVIISNYFIAIMICIYAVLYFIAYMVSSDSAKRSEQPMPSPRIDAQPMPPPLIDAQPAPPQRVSPLRAAGSFVLYSLLAGALSAVVTLPAYFGLLRSSAAGADLPKTVRFYSDMIDIIANHFALIKPSIMVGLPNIYCGLAALLLIPLYFLNKSVSLREKIANGFLICFFLISFNVNTLDFLWHGTHFPNSLFFRFAFIYVFLILTASYRALLGIEESSGREIFAVFVLLAGFILFMEAQPAEKTTKWTIYGSLLIALLETPVLILLMRARQARQAAREKREVYTAAPFVNRNIKIAEFALAALICAEVAVNAGYGIGEAGIFTKQNYLTEAHEIKPAVRAANLLEKTGDAGFERSEFTAHTTYNTPIVYGYKGLSYYSSTSYVAVNEMFGKLGLIHSNAWYVYRSAPPTLNSMFAIRYLLSRDGEFNNGIYDEADINSGVDVKVYKNTYFLPIGFMADEALLSWNLAQNNPFVCQEDFYKRAGGLKDPVFHRLEARPEKLENMTVTSGGGADGQYRYSPTNPERSVSAAYRLIADRDGPVYIYVKCPNIETVKVTSRFEPYKEYDAEWDGSTAAGSTAAGLYAAGPDDADQADDGAREITREHKINYPYIIDAQFVRAGDEVKIDLEFTKSDADTFTLYAYSFDEYAFYPVWKKLSAHGLRVTDYSDVKLTGVIDADDSGLMYTSIPYDEGWKIEVDGEPAQVETVGNGALTALRLDPGRHLINFRYMTPGLIPGAIVTLCALLLLIGINIKPFRTFFLSNRGNTDSRRALR